MGQGKEIIACQTVGDNLPLNIAFNSRYMTDFFKNCGTDRVSLETNQSLSPARLMPEGDESYTYILTPVRVISNAAGKPAAAPFPELRAGVHPSGT